MTSTPTPWRRRAVLLAAAASTASIAAPVLGRRSPIRIGRTASMTGPFSYPFVEMHKGVAAAFHEANARGGVDRRQVELVLLDDQSNQANALHNARVLAEQHEVVSFLNCGGVSQMLPVVEQARVPLVGPFNGFDALREKYSPFLLFTRPAFGAEISKIAQLLQTVAQQKCAVVYSDNELGRTAAGRFGSAATQLGNAQWKGFVSADSPQGTAQTVSAVSSWAPSSIMYCYFGRQGVPLFKELRTAIRAPAYTLSMIGVKPGFDAAGEVARGTGVSQVAPNPGDASIGIVKDFNTAMKLSGAGAPSYSALEGYIAARVLLEGLRRSGADTDRERLARSFLTMRPYDLGGFEIAFAPGNNTGSSFVELTYYTGERFRR